MTTIVPVDNLAAIMPSATMGKKTMMTVKYDRSKIHYGNKRRESNASRRDEPFNDEREKERDNERNDERHRASTASRVSRASMKKDNQGSRSESRSREQSRERSRQDRREDKFEDRRRENIRSSSRPADDRSRRNKSMDTERRSRSLDTRHRNETEWHQRRQDDREARETMRRHSLARYEARSDLDDMTELSSFFSPDLKQGESRRSDWRRIPDVCVTHMREPKRTVTLAYRWYMDRDYVEYAASIWRNDGTAPITEWSPEHHISTAVARLQWPLIMGFKADPKESRRDMFKRLHERLRHSIGRDGVRGNRHYEKPTFVVDISSVCGTHRRARREDRRDEKPRDASRDRRENSENRDSDVNERSFGRRSRK